MDRFSVSTKTGDNGTTMLFGGKRVPKSSLRLHAYGTVDELNACLGLILAEESLSKELWSQIIRTQRVLFLVGADLATPLESAAKVERISAHEADEVEKWVHHLEDALPQQTSFILPSGSRLGALFHLARTVCRRAERWVVGLSEVESINIEVQRYLNRLSDYLFVASRMANKQAGVEETAV